MIRILEDIIIKFKQTFSNFVDNYNKETFLSKYTKVKGENRKKVLGEGGNAIAYNVKNNATGEIVALKFLKTTKKEKQVRFLEEIDIVLQNCKTIDGILPILDYDRVHFWYTMPKAILAKQYITDNKLDIFQTVREFLNLVRTMAHLHDKGISHRDIKPDNIYFFNGRFYIADFGLANYPDKEHHYTRSDQGVGAIFTIAPEMKRNPKNVQDSRKADIYSLAKTLWMLIVGDETGFDGQYSYTNPLYALRLKEQFRTIHLSELELLLADCTKDNPEYRPTIHELEQRLLQWLEISSNYEKSGISDWNFLNKLIFKGEEAVSTKWNAPERIVEILNHISLLPTSNHVLFSSRGGLDMTGAELAAEKGCICINFGKRFHSILKPKFLHYDTFRNDASWNYFILETEPLQPIFDIPDFAESETLVEDIPGNYVNANDYDYGVYDYETGKRLPSTARLVERHVRGTFLIVLKLGVYNSIPDTYDGRHSACSASEFRDYIDGIIKVLGNEHSTHKDLQVAINALKKQDEVNADFLQTDKSKTAPADYTQLHYAQWNFSDCLPTTPEKNSILHFRIKVQLTSFVDFVCNDMYWLLSDGTIGKETDSLKAFEFLCREDTINALKRIDDKVNTYVTKDGYDGISPFDTLYFSTELQMTGKPTHLFTKDEIKQLMRKADDRLGNQLVIDEYGYAQLLTERNMAKFYPVSHETWFPRNNYVGPYSSLSDLQPAYIDSLVCWLRFLKTNRRQYCDFNEHANEIETINEIMQFY